MKQEIQTVWRDYSLKEKYEAFENAAKPIYDAINLIYKQAKIEFKYNRYLDKMDVTHIFTQEQEQAIKAGKEALQELHRTIFNNRWS